MHSFMSIKDVYEKDPKLANVRRVVKQSEVIEKFYEIFPDLNKVVIPKKVEREVLLLNVENPALRNELKFNGELLIEKINNFFHEERIKSIRFI
jgi:Dna[CI] antecedent, DciA